jgi:hypothetical protein
VFIFYSRLGGLVFRDGANGFRIVKVMGVGAQFALALVIASQLSFIFVDQSDAAPAFITFSIMRLVQPMF